MVSRIALKFGSASVFLKTLDHLKLFEVLSLASTPVGHSARVSCDFCMFAQRYPSEVHLNTSFMFLIKSVDMLKGKFNILKISVCLQR